MTNPIPTPPPAPEPVAGLLTSVETVLKLVLGRLDPSRATPASVRAALAAAGVHASEEWTADWLARTRAALASTDPTPTPKEH